MSGRLLRKECGVTEAFPPGFLFGAATSAYQIEGSLDVDGRGRSVWETFASAPGRIEGGADGSRACDSYRRWADDVDLLATLGLGAYRFSVSWARIVPEGRGRVEGRGLDHYERCVDALLDRGITPLITLNHWDMPEALMTHGGWAGRPTVDAFAEYAAAVVERLGDRVGHWITQNEPWIIALLGYHLGLHAPGVSDLRASVAAGHHLLLGHGAAYDAIKQVRPDVQVGIALNLLPCDPASGDPADRAAAIGSDGYCNRWYLDPLFGRGYPPDMVAHFERALGTGLDEIVRPADTERIAHRNDFLGINYYSRRITAAATTGPDRPFPWRVAGTGEEVGADYTEQGTEIAPDSLRVLLVRLARDYPRVPLVVTENGAAYGDAPTHDGQVHDQRRTSFLLRHLRAVADAIEGGADVRGYMYWSLLDNFEWAQGYRTRFGLVHVDYRTGERTIKDSARVYGEVARTRRLPDTRPGTLPAIAPFG
jgi:beta-glucosidase